MRMRLAPRCLAGYQDARAWVDLNNGARSQGQLAGAQRTVPDLLHQLLEGFATTWLEVRFGHTRPILLGRALWWACYLSRCQLNPMAQCA